MTSSCTLLTSPFTWAVNIFMLLRGRTNIGTSLAHLCPVLGLDRTTARMIGGVSQDLLQFSQKLKSHEISFIHNLFHNGQIVLTFWAEHDNDTDVLCATFQKYLTTGQSGRSPKVVALFSANNFSSYIIELLQLHKTKWNYAWIHYNRAIRSHLMI